LVLMKCVCCCFRKDNFYQCVLLAGNCVLAVRISRDRAAVQSALKPFTNGYFRYTARKKNL
jgi:hypothetical protein